MQQIHADPSSKLTDKNGYMKQKRPRKWIYGTKKAKTIPPSSHPWSGCFPRAESLASSSSPACNINMSNISAISMSDISYLCNINVQYIISLQYQCPIYNVSAISMSNILYLCNTNVQYTMSLQYLCPIYTLQYQCPMYNISYQYLIINIKYRLG